MYKKLDKDLNKIWQIIKEQGWIMEYTGSGHYRFVHLASRRSVIASSTSRCIHRIKNVLGDINRVLKDAGEEKIRL